MRVAVVASGVLLCTNLIFLGFVASETVRLTAPLPDPPALKPELPGSEPARADPPAEQPGKPPQRDTDTRSMPLAGMPGYTGADPCADLARFVAALNAALAEAGSTEVPFPEPADSALMQTSCRLDDPAVGPQLVPYRRLFRDHALSPPPAFAYFSRPKPTPQ